MAQDTDLWVQDTAVQLMVQATAVQHMLQATWVQRMVQAMAGQLMVCSAPPDPAAWCTIWRIVAMQCAS